MYVAGTRVHLPFIEKTKEEGEKITLAELAKAQQSEESIQALRDQGALLTPEEYAAAAEARDEKLADLDAEYEDALAKLRAKHAEKVEKVATLGAPDA